MPVFPGVMGVKMSFANDFWTKVPRKNKLKVWLSPRSQYRFKIPGVNWEEWGLSNVHWHMDLNEIKELRNELGLWSNCTTKKTTSLDLKRNALEFTHYYEWEADRGVCSTPRENVLPNTQFTCVQRGWWRKGSHKWKTRALKNCGQGSPS